MRRALVVLALLALPALAHAQQATKNTPVPRTSEDNYRVESYLVTRDSSGRWEVIVSVRDSGGVEIRRETYSGPDAAHPTATAQAMVTAAHFTVITGPNPPAETGNDVRKANYRVLNFLVNQGYLTGVTLVPQMLLLFWRYRPVTVGAPLARPGYALTSTSLAPSKTSTVLLTESKTGEAQVPGKVFTLKYRDTRPALEVELHDPPPAGSKPGTVGPVRDLTDADSVTLHILLNNGTRVSRPMVVDPTPTTGRATYTWAAADWDTANPQGFLIAGPVLPLSADESEHRMEYEVVGPLTARLTYPNDPQDNDILRIGPDIGQAT